MNSIYFNYIRRAICLFFIIWILPQFSSASSNYDLLFKSGSVSISENIEQFISDPAIQPGEVFSNRYFRIVQFHNIPSVSQRQTLEAGGIKLTSYFPNYAYLAIINQSADLNLLRTAGARAVVVFQPDWKMQQALLNGELPEHAKPDKQHIDLMVRYYKGLEADQVAAALQSNNYSLIRRYDYGSWIEIRVKISDINQLASLPFITGVEPIAPPSTPDDERGRSLHRSNVINTYSPMGR